MRQFNCVECGHAMGQSKEGIAKLKVVVVMFGLDVVDLFWALVVDLLVVTRVVNNGLLRLQALFPPLVKSTSDLIASIKDAGSSTSRWKEVLASPHRPKALAMKG